MKDNQKWKKQIKNWERSTSSRKPVSLVFVKSIMETRGLSLNVLCVCVCACACACTCLSSLVLSRLFISIWTLVSGTGISQSQPVAKEVLLHWWPTPNIGTQALTEMRVTRVAWILFIAGSESGQKSCTLRRGLRSARIICPFQFWCRLETCRTSFDCRWDPSILVVRLVLVSSTEEFCCLQKNF